MPSYKTKQSLFQSLRRKKNVLRMSKNKFDQSILLFVAEEVKVNEREVETNLQAISGQ